MQDRGPPEVVVMGWQIQVSENQQLVFAGESDPPLELGRQVDVPLPTTSVTNEMLTAARGMGFADQDFAVLFHTLARMSGVK